MEDAGSPVTETPVLGATLVADNEEQYCYRANCNCGLQHTTLKPSVRALIDETLKEVAEQSPAVPAPSEN